MSPVERALNYPYKRPAQSFVLQGPNIEPLIARQIPSDRLPVIACGSNGAPEQLMHKFSNLPDIPIYVTQAKLTDFICCYSAHFSSYGAIPATLSHLRGSLSVCHITWLTEAQISHMHKTEAIGVNYRFSNLNDIDLICDNQNKVNSAFAYISLHGNILVDENPVILSDIETTTPTPSLHLNQTQMQAHVRKSFSPDSSVEDFVMSNITKSDLRRDRTKILRQTSANFSYPGETVILPQG